MSDSEEEAAKVKNVTNAVDGPTVKVEGGQASSGQPIVTMAMFNHEPWILVNIGDQLENAVDGIDKLLTFLDTIYQEDDMSSAWTKYKNFNKITRAEGVTVSNYIAEFEKEYLLAKSAGCVYSDIILAFRLLESCSLTEVDEKFLLTGVDYADAKTKQNLFEQVKMSLKKF